MAKKIVTWTCEICNEPFDNEKECVAHEATHSEPEGKQRDVHRAVTYADISWSPV